MRLQLALFLSALATVSCRDASTVTSPEAAAASATTFLRSTRAAQHCPPGKHARSGPHRDRTPGHGEQSCAPLDPALEQALASARKTDAFIVIVNFDPAATTHATVIHGVLQAGAGVIRYRHLSMLAALATPRQIAAMRAVPGVQSIYLSRRFRYLLAESVPSIRADAVHASGITGRGVGIAILDSGIDGLYNPDVAYPAKTIQNVKAVADVRVLFTFAGDPEQVPGDVAEAPAIFLENVPNSETSTGHGTHVAGIAAGSGAASGGKYTGVAPGANLIGIGVGDAATMFWVLAGFDYILEHRETYNIQVVNNSWGISGAFDPADPINEATKAVHDAGVTVVFSAGNEGPARNTMNPYSVAPWVISVAAGCKLVAEDPTNSRERCADRRDRMLADLSSRGISGDPMYHPDITAPGVRIVSARASTGAVSNVLHLNDDARTCAIAAIHLPFYTCASGSSMAAPHVTGVIALMEEASGGTLTPDQALQVITSTARPMPRYALWEVGAGYLDALAAVNAVRR